MKQFEYVGANGPHAYPYDITAAIRYSDGEIHKSLYELEIGGRVATMNGYWERLPDALGERDERLERIATAILGNLIGATLASPEMARAMNDHAKAAGTPVESLVAYDAIGYAKALIAELDKQS